MKKNEFGVFEIILAARDGQPAIGHNSKIKVSIIVWSHRMPLTNGMLSR